MPSSQTAHIDTFDFGAPVALTAVKDWKVRADEGGNIYIRFENAEGDADGVVSLLVSADDTTYTATTATNNLVAVTTETIAQKTFKDFTINMRAGTDKYLRLSASGGCRMTAQLRHGGILIDQNQAVSITAVTWS
jgi:hypothetical protein